MNDLYGVSVNGAYVDVSKSIKGAKRYATLNGFSEVYARYNCGYNVTLVSEKLNNKWNDVL